MFGGGGAGNYSNSLADQWAGAGGSHLDHQVPVSGDLCAQASLWSPTAHGTGKLGCDLTPSPSALREERARSLPCKSLVQTVANTEAFLHLGEKSKSDSGCFSAAALSSALTVRFSQQSYSVGLITASVSQIRVVQGFLTGMRSCQVRGGSQDLPPAPASAL